MGREQDVAVSTWPPIRRRFLSCSFCKSGLIFRRCLLWRGCVVLLTGATGRIGTTFRAYLGDRYQLRLAVHHLDKLTDAGAHGAIELEIADPEACQRACAGMDVVVHLAAMATGRAPFYDALLDSNIKGVYNILRAAKDQGCRRVVFCQ